MTSAPNAQLTPLWSPHRTTTTPLRKRERPQGVKGLYRGLGPNFLKALPAIAISYAVFEKARTKLSSFVPRNGGTNRRMLVGGESPAK